MNSDKSKPPQFAAQFSDPTEAKPAKNGSPPNFPSAFSLFQPSMRLVQKNIANFIAIVLVPSMYFAILEWFFKPKTANHEVALWVGLIGIGVIYNVLILAARPILELGAVHGKQFGLAEVIKKGWSYFWRVFGLYLVVGAIIGVGLLLLIVPGIIMIRRYALAVYFLIDQDVGIFEAMRRSAATTKGHSGAVWGVIGVQILLGTPSWIPFIGSLISATLGMFYSCAPAMRYEQFKALGMTDAAVPPQHQAPANPVGD